MRNLHAKDGFYPTDPMRLGREVPLGEGLVDFPQLIAALATVQYAGEFIIEREITGEQQRRDIIAAAGFIDRLLTS